MTPHRTNRLVLGFAAWLLMLASAGCTTYAYVDFKDLRQTVPWVSREISTNTTSCSSFSIATEDGVDLNIPTTSLTGYVGPILEVERLAAPLFPDADLTAYEPDRVAQESRLSETEKRALDKRRKAAVEAASAFSKEAFSVIRLTPNRIEQTFIYRDVVYRKEMLLLNQPGIGCNNGILIIQQIFDGGILYEGKSAEFIRARETQFRIHSNGNLEVIEFLLDWYGKDKKPAAWKRSSFIYVNQRI